MNDGRSIDGRMIEGRDTADRTSSYTPFDSTEYSSPSVSPSPGRRSSCIPTSRRSATGASKSQTHRFPTHSHRTLPDSFFSTTAGSSSATAFRGLGVSSGPPYAGSFSPSSSRPSSRWAKICLSSDTKTVPRALVQPYTHTRHTQVIVFFVDKWIPFYTIEKWAHLASIERLVVMAITTVLPRTLHLPDPFA